MKPNFSILLAVAMLTGAALALGQDDQKPAPPAPPAAPPPNPATSPAPATPGTEARHEEHRGDRHDGGPRPPESSRHGDAPYGWHHPPGWQMPLPPPPPKPTSYIGVITTPPPAVLSAQLGLAEGFGLVVSEVLPDSPAAKAGVQRYDVLTKFNDQQLVDSGQFSTLVRALKKDAAATLTLLRKAQEQTMTVTIEERLLPERRSYPTPGGDFRHMQGLQESGRHLPDHTRSYEDRMREYQERMQAWQKNPSTEAPQRPSNDAAPAISPEEILREVRPGGVARIHLLQPDGSVTYNMANARLMLKDETGEVELTSHDGKRSLVARNAQGETIFDGPIDTDEQRKALPEDVRKKLELIEVQRKLAETPGQLPASRGIEPDVQ